MDLSAHPEVLEALDTTADPTKTRAYGSGHPSMVAVARGVNGAVRESA